MYRASIYSVTPFVIVSTTVAGFGFGLKFSQANRSTALYPSLAPSHTLSLSHSRLCTWFPLPCLCTLPLSANPPCLGQMLNLFRRIFITRDTAKAKAMYKRVPADIKICTGVSHAADAAEAVAEAHAQMQGKMGDHVPSLFLIFMTSNHDHEARSSQLAAAPPLSFLPTHPPHAHPRHHPHPPPHLHPHPPQSRPRPHLHLHLRRPHPRFHPHSPHSRPHLRPRPRRHRPASSSCERSRPAYHTLVPPPAWA